MRAIGVIEYGGPDQLAVHDVPEQHPASGEVRIAVQAVAVSPTDTNVREGNYGESKLDPPHIPGMDAAGVIDKIGEGVTGFDIGDEVMAMALPQRGHGGAYRESLIADVDSVARIPIGSTLEEASTLPMNGLTAVQAFDLLDLPAGATFAVTGAAGTLGNYAVQLAKQRGLVVVADAADKDRELVSSLGPDHVVERGGDFADKVRAIFPDGVDGVLDAAVLNEQALAAVKTGGGFATVRNWAGPAEHDITIHKVWVFSYYHHEGRLDRLRQAVEEGVLTLRVADTMPAERAADAHRRLEAGGVRGRIVLTF